jgi:hypothetical protein
MFSNLRKLAQKEGFGRYEWRSGLERELYHLRNIGHIECDSIEAIPRGQLQPLERVRITDTG